MTLPKPATRPGGQRAKALAAISAIAVLTACSSPTPASTPTSESRAAATITNCGREISLPAAPTNALIGYPTIWSTLNSLGVANSVTGYLTGGITKLPAGASNTIKEVSPQYHVPRETILTAAPDLVLLSSETQLSGENGSATLKDLQSAAIPVFIFQGNCADKALKSDTKLDTVYSDIESLGKLYHKQNEATALVNELKERVSKAASLRGDKQAPTVAFVQEYEGDLYALGLGNYAAVLDGIGAKNYFADITSDLAYVKISAETALSINADHLVVVHYNDQSPEDAVAGIKRLLPQAKPVIAGQVSAAHTDNFQVGGVPLIDVTVQIATAVYGK